MKFRKQFKFEISIKIIETAKYSFDEKPAIEFAVSEKIPTGIHPVDYLRQRLSEEIRRHASQTTISTKEEITSSGEI